MEVLRNLLERAHAFEGEAHRILARHEATMSRVITIEDTYRKLTGLSLQQDTLFREALRCVENQLFKAAHVMAWAAFIDFLEDKMIAEYLVEIQTARPKWSINGKEDLREKATEYQQIDVCHVVRLFNKNETKAFMGLLNKRNECAHPSSYSPNLNETLGFISELLTRIRTIQQKSHVAD
jgi:hypothetical protein